MNDQIIYFLKSVFIGFNIAAPIGPIGSLCISKTLTMGWSGAYAVGLGASIIDFFYGAIASIGLTTADCFIFDYAYIIRILGGLLLLYTAFKGSMSITPTKGDTKKESFFGLCIKTMLLTAASPMTILSFVSLFSTFKTCGKTHYDSLIIGSGIFFGAMIWWTILGYIVTKTKQFLSPVWIMRIKFISVMILVAYATFAITTGASQLYALKKNK